MGQRRGSAEASTVGGLEEVRAGGAREQRGPYKGAATRLGRGLDEVCDGRGGASLSREVAALSIRAKERHLEYRNDKRECAARRIGTTAAPANRQISHSCLCQLRSTTSSHQSEYSLFGNDLFHPSHRIAVPAVRRLFQSCHHGTTHTSVHHPRL